MSARDEISGRVGIAKEMLLERLQGPECPCCYRDDGSHGLGCPLPAYQAVWKTIRREHADRICDALVKDDE